jgi:hypothetical protein
MKHPRLFIRPLVAISMIGSTIAGTTDEPVVIPQSPPSDSPWEFRITPYGWFTGLEGTMGRDPVTVDIDKSFLDIAEVLKMAAALQFEARNGRWSIMADGFYAYLGASVDARPPLSGGGNLDLKQFLGEVDLAYRIHEDTRSFIDLFAGVRYNSLKLDIEIDATTPGGGKNLFTSDSADRDWADPLIGIRGQWNFDERWFVAGRADIGGFGVASDFAWNAQATVGYQFTKGFSTELGYRYFDTDYRDGDFIYDIAEHGVFLGFNFTF